MQRDREKGFRGLSSLTLKVIALVTMTIDHIAASGLADMGQGTYWLMRGIGRIAFPIYCFLLAEGFRHTRSRGRYLLRLVLFAVPSELAFDLAFNGGAWAPHSQSVMPTLAIGLVTLWGMEWCGGALERVLGTPPPKGLLLAAQAAVTLVGCAAGEALRTDYGGGGVVLAVLFYALGRRPAALAAAVAALLYLCYGGLELAALAALIPIFLYNGEKGRPLPALVGRYGFYAYYPLHLFLLYALRLRLFGY